MPDFVVQAAALVNLPTESASVPAFMAFVV